MIAAANNLKIRIGNIENTYIWAPCGEKVWSIAGPEFGEYAGMKIIIDAAVYGLRTSGCQF